MGRTLPWKRDRNGSSTENKAAISPREISPQPTTTPSTARNRSPGPQSQSEQSPTPTKTEGAEGGSGDGRGQSVTGSRPPKPEIQESLMIEGLKHDDMWRMVEDEFVAIAHIFTAHLHEAEYQRLKERARDQNADAIRSLSRPVTSPVADAVERQHVKLKRTQAAGTRMASSRAQGVDDDDLDESPWAGTNLQELMESPRKQPVPLTRPVSAVTGTRAAALDRQDNVSGRQPSPLAAKSARHVNTASRSGSIRKDHEKSVRIDPSDITGHDNDLGRGSTPAGTMASSVPKQKATAAPLTMDVDDSSDSPVETMFDRRMRERRSNRKMSRRNKSSTPDTDKGDSRPGQKAKQGPVPDSLSIPSF